MVFSTDRIAHRGLAALVAMAIGSTAVAEDPGWDFTPRPMPRIPAGVVVGGQSVEGWSNPVLFVRGKLSHGDTDAVSEMVQRYGEMFNLVLLADVAQAGPEDFYLNKVAVGFSTKIGGRDVVITRDTHKRLGANLGMIGGSVFSGNEEALKDCMQVARYRHGLIMDAPTQMIVGGRHVLRKVRHFFWVSKKTGRLGTLIWAMDDAPAGRYPVVGSAMQLLPPNMHERRDMHVDGSEFTFGIPSKQAFALVRIPQGRAIPIPPPLRQAAGVRNFDQRSYVALLTLVSQAIASAPVTASR
ncbi:MAG: pyruvate kinase [Planctomycetota bacterium]